MKVLIVEDEKVASDRLKSLRKKHDAAIEIVHVLDSVKSTAQWLMDNPSPDLLFFDIQLGDGLSFEIFDVVEVKAPVIFTTAYDEYAIKAFKVNSIDYLLKPLDYDDVKNAIQKFQALHHREIQNNLMPVLEQLRQQVSQAAAPQYKNRFIIKIGDHLKSIHVQEIHYLFSRDKATYMVTVEGKKYLMDPPLEKLEKLLDPVHFFRINRQYIITLHCIKDIISYSNSRYKILIKDCSDNDVLVSRNSVQGFKEWLGN
jgi:two-component system, LytTR family, response regulator